jgi:hypothetical protein
LGLAAAILIEPRADLCKFAQLERDNARQ